MPDRDRCRPLRDRDTGEVIATVLGPRPLTDEETGHFAAIVGAVQRHMADHPEIGAQQAERIRQVRERRAAWRARRRRLSAMRSAYRAKSRGWRSRG